MRALFWVLTQHTEVGLGVKCDFTLATSQQWGRGRALFQRVWDSGIALIKKSGQEEKSVSGFWRSSPGGETGWGRAVSGLGSVWGAGRSREIWQRHPPSEGRRVTVTVLKQGKGQSKRTCVLPFGSSWSLIQEERVWLRRWQPVLSCRKSSYVLAREGGFLRGRFLTIGFWKGYVMDREKGKFKGSKKFCTESLTTCHWTVWSDPSQRKLRTKIARYEDWWVNHVCWAETRRTSSL